jgi:Ca-activated chloride channel family protein
MNFTHPEALLLLALVWGVAIYQWRWGVRKRSRLDYPTGTWIDARPRFTLPSPFRLHLTLRTLALSLLVIALARPQEVFKKEQRTVEAIDMIISFDLSKSMEAVDFRPNRRGVAINTLMNFIDKRPDDRIGLVLFSGEAYLAVPLTVDHAILKEAVVNSSNRNLQDGTAIGQSLAVAVSHLKNSIAKSRVIVLVTDGDNNMGSVDPITAAELAKGFGIKIYAIGMGKKGRVAFPVTQIDPLTGRESQSWAYLTDAANDELLAEIAKRTGGQSFSAQDEGVLQQVFDTVDKLEKTKVETNTLVRYGELAWPWLVVGTLLILLEGLALNTRWRKLP